MASFCDPGSSAHVILRYGIWLSNCPQRADVWNAIPRSRLSHSNAASACIWNCTGRTRDEEDEFLHTWTWSRFHLWLSIFWTEEWKTLKPWFSWYSSLERPYQHIKPPPIFVCRRQNFCYVSSKNWKNSTESLSATTQKGGKKPPTSCLRAFKAKAERENVAPAHQWQQGLCSK